MIRLSAVTIERMRAVALKQGVCMSGPVRAQRVTRTDPRRPHKVSTFVVFRVRGFITNIEAARHALKLWQEKNK